MTHDAAAERRVVVCTGGDLYGGHRDVTPGFLDLRDVDVAQAHAPHQAGPQEVVQRSSAGCERDLRIDGVQEEEIDLGALERFSAGLAGRANGLRPAVRDPGA